MSHAETRLEDRLGVMNIADITTLFAYNRWANERTIASTRALTDEELRRDLKSSFPSVFATLVHMLSAEWIWLERWNGSSPSSWPGADKMKNLDTLVAEWRTVESGQSAFIATLDQDAIERRMAYRSLKGDPFNDPVGLTMQHLVNHSTYHRGQVATMLRQLGKVPQGIDFVSFVRL